MVCIFNEIGNILVGDVAALVVDFWVNVGDVTGAAVTAEQTFLPLNMTPTIVGKVFVEGYQTLNPTVLNRVPAFWIPL